MKRIEILALLSLSLSSCSEYFDKQQSKNELKKMNLITNLKKKEIS